MSVSRRSQSLTADESITIIAELIINYDQLRRVSSVSRYSNRSKILKSCLIFDIL